MMARRTSRTRLARGYTTIEVMLAMTILTIGAAGVMSMQRAAIQADRDARDMDVGTAVARTWVERVRREASFWTLPGATNANNNLNGTGVGGIANCPDINGHVDQGWFIPAVVNDSDGNPTGPIFDSLGRDIAAPADPDARFCAHLRLDSEVLAGGISPVTRLTVRVFWPRNLLVAPDPSFCSAGVMANVNAATATGTYHFVYLTSAIRQNPLP